MKRERDRIRNLLLRLEGEPQGFLIVAGLLNASDEERADEYHLKLMADEGLVVETDEAVWRLTALGHDAVEALEVNAFWEKLKSAGPKEAYELLKGATSSLAVTAISKLMGWG
ncbi:MAG: hypothetical protein WBB85_17425 [Albidovulum sp.]|uniref:hypothetical protein n=1 Tax=Albidovulum sp. TaxID=1872424 RepID=UPI003CA95E39